MNYKTKKDKWNAMSTQEIGAKVEILSPALISRVRPYKTHTSLANHIIVCSPELSFKIHFSFNFVSYVTEVEIKSE